MLPETVATAIAVGFRIFQTLIELGYVGLVVLIDRPRSLPRARSRARPGS